MAEIETVLGNLENVKITAAGWSAKCPSHDDKKSSLTIALGKDGKILMNCKAGCEFAKVVTSLGYKQSDFFPTPSYKKPKIVAVYPYLNTDGKEEFQKVRFEPKDFRQRHLSNSGEYVWNKKGRTNVLYNLQELIHASNSNKICYFVEGEKDVHTLKDIGFIATTCADGAATNITTELLAPLKSFSEVRIIADRDKAGYEFAKSLEHSLLELGIITRTLVSKLEKTKSDVSDHLAAGYTLDDLIPLDSADALDEEIIPMAHEPEGLYGIWITRRFKRLSKGKLEYSNDIAGDSGWLAFNGKFWEPNPSKSLDIALELSRELKSEAYLNNVTEAKNKQILKAAIKVCSTGSGLNSLRSLAAEIMKKESTDYDCEPTLLNVQNGVINLQTGELRQANPNQRFTTVAPVLYSKTDTESGTWGSFIKSTFPDPELRKYVQRSIGYLVSGLNREQVFFIWYGSGANGKSVLSQCISSVLGDSFFKSSQFSVFTTAVQVEAKLREFGRLRGARIVVASEPKEGSRFDTGCLKEVTGGEAVVGRHLFCNSFTYTPTWKLVFMANNLPKVTETDFGTWRRIRAIPFTKQVPIEKQDRALAFKLISSHKEQILNWIIEGSVNYFKDGLGSCSLVDEATEEYKKSEDIIGNWIEDNCYLESDITESPSLLWKDFENWASSQGHKSTLNKMNSASLSKDLIRRGFITKRSNGLNWKVGIGLKKTPDVEWQ